MKVNLGSTDRLARLLFTAVLAGNGIYFGWTWAIVLAAYLLVTALVGRCPLYLPFGMSTLTHNRPQGNAL